MTSTGQLPTGEVTFLFTDIEGSTRLLAELGAERYAEALAEHRRVLREAFASHGGVEVDTQGDAFFVAFQSAPGALRAAAEAQAALSVPVRMGIHTGEPLVADGGYVGHDVHLAARIAASGHGGQVLLSQAARAAVDGEVTDLGMHRLKDIEAPVAIFQLGDVDFPPLKTISNTNLPRPASSFVGRERELAAVLATLERGARLLTFTGPGGTGKTRLAIEAAASLVPDYKAGVFWVGLATLRDPAIVIETIAETLGAKQGLAKHIGEADLLLLLDNLEQVVEAAPELASLVETCPNLTLLVTSRELLRVRNEVEYPVPPLAESDAVPLFCQRARLEPTEEIADLCRRLDNLPLAVELAAARTNALSPAQILDRLSQRLDLFRGGRDVDPRQQTLRATIEWSYELLSPKEQGLFRRLAVFAGGCTLEAAEDVVEADLDTLQSLVEKSLLRFSDERYWMLETIREYAGEKLQGAGEVRRRHAAFYGQLVEGLFRAVRSHETSAMLTLDAELPNCRAGIEEALERRDARLAGKFLFGLWFYWLGHGYAHEAKNAATSWLELDRGGLEASEVAQALVAVSEIVRFVKDGPRDDAAQLAIALKQEIVTVLRDHPEAAIVGWSREGLMAATLTDLAYLALEAGDPAAAKRYAAEGLNLRRRLGESTGISHALTAVGTIAAVEGDLRAANRLLVEGLEHAHDHPEAPAMQITVAETELLLGEIDAAAARVLANIDGIRGLAHRVFVAAVARVAGLIAFARHDVRTATRLLGAEAHIFDEVALEERAVFGNVQELRRRTGLALDGARLALGDDVAARLLAEGGTLDDREILDLAAAALALDPERER